MMIFLLLLYRHVLRMTVVHGNKSRFQSLSSMRLGACSIVGLVFHQSCLPNRSYDRAATTTWQKKKKKRVMNQSKHSSLPADCLRDGWIIDYHTADRCSPSSGLNIQASSVDAVYQA